MSRRRIGGAARLVDPPLSMADLREVVERSEQRGFEMGLEAAERVSRLPVNDCPMCQLRAEHRALEDEVRVRRHGEPARRRQA